MKQKLTIAFLLVLTATIAQNNRIEAYRILTNGKKVDGFIRPSRNIFNPITTNFYLTTDGDKIIMTPSNTMEYGTTDNRVKFIAKNIPVDQANDKQLVNEQDINTINRTVFLNTIVDGPASLYKYSTNDNVRYYISKEGNDVQLLEYQIFLNSESTGVETNEPYKRVLSEELNCGKIDFKAMGEMSYTEEDLIEYIVAYNECENNNYSVLRQQENLKGFSARILAGVDTQYLTVNSQFDSFDGSDIDNSSSLRVAGQLELRISKTINGWSLITEIGYNAKKEGNSQVSYRSVVGSDDGLPVLGTVIVPVNYEVSSIDVTFGAIKSFYLNDNLNLQASAKAGYLFTSEDSFIRFQDRFTEVIESLDDRPLFGIGLGFELFNKFSLNVDYFVPVVNDEKGSPIFEPTYSGLRATLGYRIF
ncbi:hypothetical protein [Nonlabens ponticola]|uniref:Outer membrane protein beta-barrel domain-containing protein n=1 Tax=Nonlabens ponticola TaxID=2496866 RepID=A0A3S9MX85_9FLAO|nr:hypothetical protein [Nonlabens ponticola]AZQ43855.1 hypothetical protein EJ995_06290 [Nonlabens ponticola]